MSGLRGAQATSPNALLAQGSELVKLSSDLCARVSKRVQDCHTAQEFPGTEDVVAKYKDEISSLCRQGGVYFKRLNMLASLAQSFVDQPSPQRNQTPPRVLREVRSMVMVARRYCKLLKTTCGEGAKLVRGPKSSATQQRQHQQQHQQHASRKKAHPAARNDRSRGHRASTFASRSKRSQGSNSPSKPANQPNTTRGWEGVEYKESNVGVVDSNGINTSSNDQSANPYGVVSSIFQFFTGGAAKPTPTSAPQLNADDDLSDSELHLTVSDLTHHEKSHIPQLQQKQVKHEDVIAQSKAIARIQDRKERVEKIHDGTVTVSAIMQGVADMVHAQSPFIDDIEANTVNVVENTKAGEKALRDASEYQRRRRKHCLYGLLCGVIMLIAILVMFGVLMKIDEEVV